MIYTSSHKDCITDILRTVAISGNRGRDVNYTKEAFPLLAPKRSFWKIWHDNLEVLSEEESISYYVEEYYKLVLSLLNPEEVYKQLDNSILLCYEDHLEFCHRHIVAAWFHLSLGIEIEEVKVKGTNIEVVEKPTCYPLIENILKEAIYQSSSFVLKKENT